MGCKYNADNRSVLSRLAQVDAAVTLSDTCHRDSRFIEQEAYSPVVVLPSLFRNRY
ncbi:uncharacterized protein PHALS_13335 [Plasmopara halstedii]|uniref:Uncharacterized protein n=1 Tax=Plasmopara halstedii TaxID=4781 RepID=A0A0P1AP90_PLAHL|nr:uncharacterized protein PHALS_13335 [Plasmopara halstedii]CEG43118.1 hypothetical protein PHALS_13335 [Plasmopara halstedii]|eukprot:XP_024579487.1 hypothetical protein PHALS_13335 [Plasmopara halstedii]